MKRTIQLFQLMLTVFGFYMAVTGLGLFKTAFPVSCLIVVFLLDKLAPVIEEKNRGAEKDATPMGSSNIDSAQKTQKILNCLLQSKNTNYLKDAVTQILRMLGISVLPGPEDSVFDQLLRLEDGTCEFGLKIVGDINDLAPEWNLWPSLGSFEMGKGAEKRVLIVGSNTVDESTGSVSKFRKFPPTTIKLLKNYKIVAMSTLTLHKIYQLCTEKEQDPMIVFQLIHHHPGGVFQLEDYITRREKNNKV